MTPAEIRAIRKENGITLKQMAEIIGKSTASLSFYESGRVKVPAEVEERLRKYFSQQTLGPDFELLSPNPSWQRAPKAKKTAAAKSAPTLSGDELRAMRTARHLSQKDFASLLGVSSQSIIHYEKGRTKIPQKVVDQLGALPPIIEQAPSPKPSLERSDKRTRASSLASQEGPKAASEYALIADILSRLFQLAPAASPSEVLRMLGPSMPRVHIETGLASLTLEEVLQSVPEGVSEVHILPDANLLRWKEGDEDKSSPLF